MNQNITPAEALFAIYKAGAENDASTVYNVPTNGRETERGTVYMITSNDRRVPEENIIFGRDTDGLPYIVDVEDWA